MRPTGVSGIHCHQWMFLKNLEEKKKKKRVNLYNVTDFISICRTDYCLNSYLDELRESLIDEDEGDEESENLLCKR